MKAMEGLMKLTFEQIKEITVGAVSIWEEENGVHFGKCTKAQIEAWRIVEAGLVNNAIPTTGVRFDFHTNSSFVKVCFNSFGKYEVKINGIFKKQYLFTRESENKEIIIELDGENAENHLVIVLPNHFEAGVVASFEVSDGAYVRPHVFDRKILFVGDSITQGFNSIYNLSSYAYLISDYLNADSVIQGIGGSRFSPSTVLETGYKPDIVFIAYGTNDFAFVSSLAKMEKNAREYITKLQALYTGAKFFLITPIWRMDEDKIREMGTFKEARACIKCVAEKLSVEVIDGYDLIPQLPEFMADSIHPNDLGFSLYALNVLKQLQGKI